MTVDTPALHLTIQLLKTRSTLLILAVTALATGGCETTTCFNFNQFSGQTQVSNPIVSRSIQVKGMYARPFRVYDPTSDGLPPGNAGLMILDGIQFSDLNGHRIKRYEFDYMSFNPGPLTAYVQDKNGLVIAEEALQPTPQAQRRTHKIVLPMEARALFVAGGGREGLANQICRVR